MRAEERIFIWSTEIEDEQQVQTVRGLEPVCRCNLQVRRESDGPFSVFFRLESLLLPGGGARPPVLHSSRAHAVVLQAPRFEDGQHGVARQALRPIQGRPSLSFLIETSFVLSDE